MHFLVYLENGATYGATRGASLTVVFYNITYFIKTSADFFYSNIYHIFMFQMSPNEFKLFFPLQASFYF